MKKPKRTTKSYSITVPIALLPEIKRRAREEGRNVSNYLCRLMSEDESGEFLVALDRPKIK
jgi:hypothetical protein